MEQVGQSLIVKVKDYLTAKKELEVEAGYGGIGNRNGTA